MRAMGISGVNQTIDMQYLSTLKNCITGSSKAKTFYIYLIYKHSHYNMGRTAACYSDVLPNHGWQIMYDWYCNLHVQIKWNGMLRRSIKVSIGTRQGGLTSPMLFNVLYQELVHLLSTCYSEITINNETYNVFCYADDIILASLSIAGLQQLIDTARSFIKAEGLNFNPSKTVCTIFGKHHLTTAPKWILNDTILTGEKQVKYLGSILSNNPADHVESRCKSARKAFYALQSAGLCKNGVDPAQ